LNTVLRKIFGPKRDEVTGGWRKLHNEELHELYSSPGIGRIIKSRRMRWTRHVARMGENSNAYGILVRKPRDIDHWEDQDVGVWITLTWILYGQNGVVWTGLVWLRIRKSAEIL
jgi:hypothetical protein